MPAKFSSIHLIVAWITLEIAVVTTNSGLAFEVGSALLSDGEQLVREASQPRRRPMNGRARVYRNRVAPHWVGDNTKFWYRNDLPDRGREFVLVDAVERKREPAFDHEAVAAALGEGATAFQLPIESLEFDAEGELTALVGNGKRYAWDPTTNSLTELAADAENGRVGRGQATTDATNRQPSRTGAETSIRFVNKLTVPAEIFWIRDSGSRQSYGKIEASADREQHTYGGHRWEIVDDKGESFGEIVADDRPTEVIIDGRRYESERPPRRRARAPRSANRSSGRSPDGKWVAEVENYNVTIKSTESDESIVLSTDGREGLAYSQPIWSPDSQTLVSFRVESVEKELVHLVRSSPEQGGRAQLQSRPYALPGDPFPSYEPNLFRIESGQHTKPEVDPFEHEWLRPRVRFRSDGTRFTYEQTDRGHGRFRLIEIDIEDGSVRNIIDERSPTFIWTAHTENQSLSIVNWLEQTDEIIHATEKNGWRQLILVDALTGEEKRELTPRGIVVRGVDRIDEQQRRIWLTASGREGQDPYFIHYAHVDLDSGNLTWLTDGDGMHSIEYSPDEKYLIDSYSRVDMGPVHELRRVEDGELICSLERADLSELESEGWNAPEIFVAKGRDGQTDIWGIICRPRDYDPSRKYPVLEDIYAGPHGSFVPKSFSASTRYETLTSLGFIVVKIDGMGTANRSKAFHDVCWKNLKDGGFPDRIAWMRAAAEIYPELDLSRVGVYGTSAGGQNAAAAVLFYPEFYKAAVAACGCHDNRMDKASWNEQWMSYPVGPQYSESSNIENAHRLRGKLMLIVGEMDTNVPPESTLRFADALIRADKDFDLLVIPNAGHGMGGAYGQRRMRDFFVRHLLGEDPTAFNAAEPRQRPRRRADIAATEPDLAERDQREDAGTTTGASEDSGNSEDSCSVTVPPESFFPLVRERDRAAALSFYRKYLNIGGLPVVASEQVSDEALLRTREIVSHMLAGRPDVLEAMCDNGMYLIIIGKDQVYTDMPEYRHHPNPAFQNERVRGTGGKPTSFGEENLLGLTFDRYDDESIGVHEFCHTIDGALRSLDPTWSDRLRNTFQAAREKKLYEGAYAGTNAGEYWAEICQAYFDCNRVNNWNHGPIGTREQLKAYDPRGYELVRNTFRLAPDQDWRYRFPRQLPTVEGPPAKGNLDPYYTKFSWAREFTIVGRDASEEAILRANDIVRKMFAYRHDILKALIAEDLKLVVLGRHESLGDLPELQGDGAGKQVDLLARYLEYSPAVNLIVVGEENVLSNPAMPGVGDSQLIRVLAHAIHQITGMRPEDPRWTERPRNVWQQYELRLTRLDVRFDERLKDCFERAMAEGKWRGTSAVHGRSAYWVTGVLAYFDACGQNATPTDSVRAIETREHLATYDPDLFALVNETMAFDHRVDWRLPRSADK